MASIIVTDGQLANRTDLTDPADIAKYEDGMKEFGRLFEYKHRLGERDDALRDTFVDMLVGTPDNPPRYFAYRFRRGANKALKRIKNPRYSPDETAILFDFGAKTFVMKVTRDRARMMHVSMPDTEDVFTYLSQILESLDRLSNPDEQKRFLLANSPISRCK